MAIACKDLLRLPSFKKIQLLAGKNGLNNPITWPYINQSDNILDWIHGGELVFITGMETNYTSDRLINVVSSCAEFAAAGIVILCHKEYIPEIPEQICNLCDKLALPLFKMPWELKIIDVTKEIANLIILNRFQEQHNTAFLTELLFSKNPVKEKVEKSALHCGITLDKNAFFAVFGLHCPVDIENIQLLRYVEEEVEQKLSFHKYINVSMINSGFIIFYIQSEMIHKEKIHNILKDIWKNHKNCRLFCGIGDIGNNIETLRESYNKAVKAKNIAENYKNLHIVLQYNSLGIETLFDCLNEKYALNYCRLFLHSLSQTDKQQNTEYLLTLQTYLANDTSLLRTAESLYIHRNTIVYRMEKIKAITGCSFTDMKDKANYFLAFKLANFFDFWDIL